MWKGGMLGADGSVSTTAVRTAAVVPLLQGLLPPLERRVLGSAGPVETLSEDWTLRRGRKRALRGTSSWLFTVSAGDFQGCVSPI